MKMNVLQLSTRARNGLDTGAWLPLSNEHSMRVSLLTPPKIAASLPSADIPITSSDFWQNEDEFTEDVLKHIFRSTTEEEVPMLQERMACLREAGRILYEVCNSSCLYCMGYD